MKTLLKILAFYVAAIIHCINMIVNTVCGLFYILIFTPLNMLYCGFCKDMSFDEWFEHWSNRHRSTEEES